MEAATAATGVGSAAGMGTAAEASPAAGRIGARDAAMIETAEGAGMNADGCVAGKSAVVAETSMVETRGSAIEMTVIAKGSAVGDVGAVVVFHPAAVPVGAPVVPSPAKAAENSDAYA